MRRRRLVAVPLAAAVVAGLMAGCHAVAGPSNLVGGAPVKFADVTVGQVRSISLRGSDALVTMDVNRSADVPAGVSAQVRRTSVLGERYVALLAPAHPGEALLADGTRIAQASIEPGIEELVSAGTRVVGAVGTSQLAALVAAGAQGFGGQGPALRALLDDMATVTGGYASHSSSIRTLITSLDQLSSSLAPSAGADAEALSNLAQTTGILAAQSSRFEDLLAALDNLSVQGRQLLGTYLGQITDQLGALRTTAQALAAKQQDLGSFLDYLSGHNLAVHEATLNHFVQVLDDIIVCGLPGGGEVASSPVSSCSPPSGGGG
jgi:phospholipid/cholesterol/gamma-HCH transport system substrate-binding protein